MSAEAPGSLFSSKVSYLVVPTKAAGLVFTAKETEAQRAEGPTSPSRSEDVADRGAACSLTTSEPLCGAAGEL